MNRAASHDTPKQSLILTAIDIGLRKIHAIGDAVPVPVEVPRKPILKRRPIAGQGDVVGQSEGIIDQLLRAIWLIDETVHRPDIPELRFIADQIRVALRAMSAGKHAADANRLQCLTCI